MNSAYPVGSVHRKHDLYKSLPREDMGFIERDWRETRNFCVGFCWAVVISGIFYTSCYMLWRVLAK